MGAPYLCEFIKKYLGLFQVGGVKPFGHAEAFITGKEKVKVEP